MRLNKLTDYAVLILIPLAHAWPDGRLLASSSLADVSNVPGPTVSKLLKVLTRAGLLDSVRGVSGGYKLSRSPRDISVADIMLAVEGPIALTDCVTGAQGDCDRLSMCWMNGRWDAVNAAVSGALSQVSLLEMMPSPLTFEPSFEEREMAASARAKLNS